MSLQYRFDKLMKKIGAYTISDEVIEFAELYRSLAPAERKWLDAVDGADLSIDEVAGRLGLAPEQARSMYDKVHDRLDCAILCFRRGHPVS
jgi:hypothetical protein